MNPLIVALDVEDEVQAIDICEELSGQVDLFKVGFGLYLTEGEQIIQVIRELGKNIFLDLKLLDIPNTIKEASKVIAKKRVKMFTVHTLGGKAMLKAAVAGVKEAKMEEKPSILGVTILTSLDQSIIDRQLPFKKSLSDIVVDLAKMAKESGLDGIVCSAGEASTIRQVVGNDFLIVTPGIRLSGEEFGDQKRVYTPREALASGANYLVVGRPIIEATNRRRQTEKFLKDIHSFFSA